MLIGSRETNSLPGHDEHHKKQTMGRSKLLFMQERETEEHQKQLSYKQLQINKTKNIIMGASNSEHKNVKFYGLKAKVDETNDPFFGLSEKVEDKWKTTQQYNQIEGNLVKAEIRENEYDGVKTNVFYITLKDEEGESVVKMTHNQITYSIISTLCSATVPNPKVFIRVYKEQSGTYWNGKAYIELDGVKTGWAIDPRDAPKPEKVVKADGSDFLQNGKPVYDSMPRQKFYEEAFLSKVVPLAAGKPVAPVTNNHTQDEAHDAENMDPDDPNNDLPF